MKKMFINPGYQGDANKNENVILPQANQNGLYQKGRKNTSEDMKQQKLLFTLG